MPSIRYPLICFLLVSIVSLSGCSGDANNRPEPEPSVVEDPALGDSPPPDLIVTPPPDPIEIIKQNSTSKQTNIVPVYYATNRVPVSNSTSTTYYTGEWRDELEYGLSLVSIPPTHTRGVIERPKRFLFMTFTADPKKHVVLLEPPSVFSKEEFVDRLQKNSESGVREILVFIHGFNVDFEEAILRSGQLGFDLDFQGPVVAFSWPSEGKTLDYGKDVRNNRLSTKHIKELFEILQSETGHEKIHVIAHSMGTRALTGALQSMSPQSSNTPNSAKINQVILAAPDIDKVVFESEIAPQIVDKADRITLYASSKDKALMTSKKLYGEYSRAGLIAGDEIVDVAGVDTIDVSNVDSGWLGYLSLNHSAYGDELIDDIFLLIRHSFSPKERNLQAGNNNTNWVIPR